MDRLNEPTKTVLHWLTDKQRSPRVREEKGQKIRAKGNALFLRGRHVTPQESLTSSMDAAGQSLGLPLGIFSSPWDWAGVAREGGEKTKSRYIHL